MSMLKFDHDVRPDIQLKHSDLRAHYDIVAVHTLLSIARHWRFIASFVALMLVLACIAIPLMPRKYSATALVYPSLFSTAQGKTVALASIEASSIVAGEARLIVSDTILPAAVKRLGLDSDPSNTKAPSWTSQGLDWLRAMLFPETTRNKSPFDRMVAMLRKRIEVVKDTRSYLISVSFTGASGDEAAEIVNAVTLEYLREKDIQRRQGAAQAAEDELTRQLAIYGEKHPKVLQAVADLSVARAALKAAMEPEGGPGTVVADESVRLATPSHTPTSPKGFTILALSFVLGLLAAIGLTVWCDRRGLEPLQFGAGFLPEVAVWRRLGVGLASRFLPEAAVWRRLGVGLASRFRRVLGALSFRARRQQTAALPSGVPSPIAAGTNEADAARSSSARRGIGRRFRNRNVVGREEHPPGP
jgi:hypothetical protein